MQPYSSRFRFKHKTYSPRRVLAFDWPLAYRHALYLSASLFILVLIFGIPILYLINKNFDFFIDMSTNKYPKLLSHLEREKVWVSSFVVFMILSLVGLSFYVSLRWLGRFTGPIGAIEGHLRELIKGHWYLPELRVREDDEFKGLVKNYSYFYKTLQANTQQDIKLLEKLAIDPNNREAYLAWQNLLQRKRELLGNEDVAIANIEAAAAPPKTIQFKRSS